MTDTALISPFSTIRTDCMTTMNGYESLIRIWNRTSRTGTRETITTKETEEMNGLKKESWKE